MKGHTAFEYMMTYGWMIIIAVVVAGVFSYYGMLSPSGYILATTNGFDQVQVLSTWSINSDSGDMQLNLQSTLETSIAVLGANVTIDGSTISYATSRLIPPGKSSLTTFTANSWTEKKSGERYTADVEIFYIYNGSIFSSFGTITGTYS